jgi:hypothetical protein
LFRVSSAATAKGAANSSITTGETPNSPATTEVITAAKPVHNRTHAFIALSFTRQYPLECFGFAFFSKKV